MDIKFEKVSIQDKEKVIELTKNTWDWGDYIEKVFDHWINEGLFIKAISNGEILGIIHAKIFDDFAWLEGIRVKRELRRKGIGKELTLKAIQLSNKKIIRLLINEKNIPSLSLVKSLGFKEIDRFYYDKGKKVSLDNIIKNYGFYEAKNLILNLKGFVNDWVWFPIKYYNGKVYAKNSMILLNTDPPFLLGQENVDFEHNSIVKKDSSEGFIVFELNLI